MDGLKFWLKGTFAIAIACGIFFRFYQLDAKVYWHDEVLTSLKIAGAAPAEVRTQLSQLGSLSVAELAQYQFPNPEKTVLDTVNALATAEPQNPPLYYVLAWFWLHLWGHTAAVIRSLSAVFGVLVIPLTYWLCRELFDSSAVSLLGAALVATSPLHVLYAQEARQFSCWTLLAIAASLLLLRYLRRPNFVNLGVYTLSNVLSLYTFPFSLLIMAGHGFYALYTEGGRWGQKLWKLLGSFIVSLLMFSPWLWFIIQNSDQMNDWRQQAIPLSNLIKSWLGNLSRVFFDLNLGSEDPLIYTVPITVGLTLLSLYGIGYTLWKFPRAGVFILALGLPLFLTLAIPDLGFGGRRSTVGRYLLPAYVGIELAVAFALGRQLLARGRGWKTYFGQGACVVLMAAGLISCAYSAQADRWWNKFMSVPNPDIAIAINQAPNPRLYVDVSASGTSMIELLSLSYRLQKTIDIYALSGDMISTLSLPENYQAFLYDPSDELLTLLAQAAVIKTAPVLGDQLIALEPFD